MSDHFGFSKVTLLKDQALGRGSYGSVCKAKCDTLTCAAKIIHSLLFDLADPGVRKMMSRFEQECQLFAAIKHPNIVQYLGTCTDEDTGLPVLLMELMDHNLTHFLEEMAPHTPPFHTQLDFCLDVTSALAYLHSNSILHRDLSSNNILLLGDRRAKVTDFGMSRLEKVTPRMTPATTCPGTMFYMPPEALKDRPLHMDKLDVFSFGVVVLQMLTGKFPEPSDRFTTLQVPDPNNKRRTIEAQVAVKEVERRQNHISLVQDGSPLLQVSLACLEDKHEDRPTATTLCAQLEEMRTLDAYRNSAETNHSANYHQFMEETRRNEATLEDLRVQLAKAEEELETLQQTLDTKDNTIHEKHSTIMALSSDFTLHWKKSTNAPVKFKGRGHTAVAGKVAYFYEFGQKIHQFDVEQNVWSTLPDPPVKGGFTIVTIYDLFLTTIGGYGNQEGKLYTYMGKKGGEEGGEKGGEEGGEKGGQEGREKGGKEGGGEERGGEEGVEKGGEEGREKGGEEGGGEERGEKGGEEGVNKGGEEGVNKGGEEGGEEGGKKRGEEEWVEKFPSTGSLIFNPFACSTYDRVIVLGRPLARNEMIGSILDLETLEWSHFNPYHWFSDTIYHSAFMFVTNDTVYHSSGCDFSGPTDVFYSCPLQKIQDSKAWKRCHHQLYHYQTVVCIDRNILGVGGRAETLKAAKDPPRLKTVCIYDVDLDSWSEFGEMEVARSECMVAVVGNKMIVVGGEDSEEDTSCTDIATIV